MGDFRVNLGPNSHLVHISAGALDRVGELARAAGLKPSRAALVTDSVVAPLYAGRVTASLRAADFEPATAIVDAGEASKSLGALSGLFDRFAAAGLDRSSAVFALGGGVVGDLAGFAAAVWMRGVAVVQIPTTMLAQVDSALGGKTGINHSSAKNLIGAFHQPRLVVADVAALATLPDRAFREGLAEVIKYGAIMDAPMIAALEAAMPAILRRDPDTLVEFVERSLRHKAFVVENDEREGGLRKILNFGHTVGHALEASAGYGSLLHGEAVAIGMGAATALSRACANLSATDAERLLALIRSAGLETRLPAGWRGEEFERALKLDKKRSGAGVEFVLIDRLGHAFTKKLGFDEIIAALA